MKRYHTKLIRVLFFEPYPMGLGGNFLTQRLILERLDRRRFTPIVISPVEGVALEEFRKMGIECETIAPPGNLDRYGGTVLQLGIMSRAKVAIDLLRYNLKLAHFIREKRIDIVYANCVRAEMSIGIAACLVGVPSLLYVKGELSNPLIDRLSLALATKIMYQCEQNRDDKYRNLVRFCHDKIEILKPGLDPEVFNRIEQKDIALPEELDVDLVFKNTINTVVPCQLYPLKGQHLVIEALSRLVNDFPKVRLYLLGDHVIDEYRFYKFELERIIEKYGLENYVRFTGWRKDALDIVSLMDIVIHPSFSEGFPGAVLEAMALRKPVIASKVGGLREAVKDGENGFLVEPGDVNAIESCWRKLLMNPKLRIQMGEAAKKTVFTEYLIDDKVAQLARVWEEMVLATREPA